MFVSAVACMRLLGGAQVPLKFARGATCRPLTAFLRNLSLSLYRRLTPPITRRPTPQLQMTSHVSAVGCIGLFGGDAAPRARGAHSPCLSLPRRGLGNQSTPRRHITPVLFSRGILRANLYASCFATSRRTPRITRPPQPLLVMTSVVSRVACMRLLDCGSSLAHLTPRRA